MAAAFSRILGCFHRPEMMVVLCFSSGFYGRLRAESCLRAASINLEYLAAAPAALGEKSDCNNFPDTI